MSNNTSKINIQKQMVKEAYMDRVLGGAFGALTGGYWNYDPNNPFSSIAKGALAGGTAGALLGPTAVKWMPDMNMASIAGDAAMFAGTDYLYRKATGQDVNWKDAVETFGSTIPFSVLAPFGFKALGKGYDKIIGKSAAAAGKAVGGNVAQKIVAKGAEQVTKGSAADLLRRSGVSLGYTAAGAGIGAYANYDPNNPFSSMAKGALAGGAAGAIGGNRHWDGEFARKYFDKGSFGEKFWMGKGDFTGALPNARANLIMSVGFPMATDSMTPHQPQMQQPPLPQQQPQYNYPGQQPQYNRRSYMNQLPNGFGYQGRPF